MEIMNRTLLKIGLKKLVFQYVSEFLHCVKYEKQQIFCSVAKKGRTMYSQKPMPNYFQPFSHAVLSKDTR